VLVFVVSAPRARAEWVDWIADAEVDLRYTDNLNNSAFNADEEQDFFWIPAARGGRIFQLTDRTRMSLAAEVAGEIYHEFDGLDAIEAGGSLGLTHKFGVGRAPWLRASFFGGYKEVRESERSGPRLEAGLEIGKRFSPRFDASLAYLYTNRDGGDGVAPMGSTLPTDVFDQQYHLITLSGNFLLAPPLLVTAGYTFRTGDFDSACTPGNAGEALSREKGNIEAIALDGVFGGCVYRLDGTGHSGFINFSYGFTNRLSLDLGYRYLWGKGDSLTYERNTVQLALLFRY